MNRRSFIRTASVAAAPGGGAAPENTIREPARQIPVVEENDVVVCGSGPAGVVAAIASARAGARTRLLESQGSLGGIWTVGLMTELADAENKKGIVAEIFSELKRLGGIRDVSFDPEVMKLVLQRKCLEAGVHVRLHTSVVAARKGLKNRVTHAVTESKSGREAWAARVFVDATGDGDLAAMAGCGFDLGHPETHEMQPFSLRCTLSGIGDTNAPFFTAEWSKRAPMVRQEIERAGLSPSYSQPSFFVFREGIAGLMANHEYSFSPLDAEAVTRATLQARDEVNRIVAGLRSLGGIWSNLWLAATAEMIGMRESRRIHGLYTLTAEDALRGARFADAVCRATYPIDIHSTNPKKDKGVSNAGLKMKPFDIPLRCLIPKDADGLLVAGRCISGDHFAHGSYRISGNAAATGEAAGKTAAIAARSGRLPREIKFAELGMAAG